MGSAALLMSPLLNPFLIVLISPVSHVFHTQIFKQFAALLHNSVCVCVCLVSVFAY